MATIHIFKNGATYRIFEISKQLFNKLVLPHIALYFIANNYFAKLVILAYFCYS